MLHLHCEQLEHLGHEAGRRKIGLKTLKKFTEFASFKNKRHVRASRNLWGFFWGQYIPHFVETALSVRLDNEDLTDKR